MAETGRPLGLGKRRQRYHLASSPAEEKKRKRSKRSFFSSFGKRDQNKKEKRKVGLAPHWFHASVNGRVGGAGRTGKAGRVAAVRHIDIQGATEGVIRSIDSVLHALHMRNRMSTERRKDASCVRDDRDGVLS